MRAACAWQGPNTWLIRRVSMWACQIYKDSLIDLALIGDSQSAVTDRLMVFMTAIPCLSSTPCVCFIKHWKPILVTWKKKGAIEQLLWSSVFDWEPLCSWKLCFFLSFLMISCSPWLTDWNWTSLTASGFIFKSTLLFLSCRCMWPCKDWDCTSESLERSQALVCLRRGTWF